MKNNSIVVAQQQAGNCGGYSNYGMNPVAQPPGGQYGWYATCHGYVTAAATEWTSDPNPPQNEEYLILWNGYLMCREECIR
jgi:hypothetical protein